MEDKFDILKRADNISKIYESNKEATKDYHNTVAYQYVKNKIKDFYSTFDGKVSLDKILEDIYNTLLYDKYSEKSISNGYADNKIIEYITDNYFNIKYNYEFKEIYDFVREKTYTIFQEEKALNKNNLYYYDSFKERNIVSFIVSNYIFSNNINLEDIYINGNLKSIIKSEIFKRLSELESISEEISFKTTIEKSKYKKTISYDDFKAAVLIALAGLGILAVYYKKNDNKNE